MTQRKKLLVDQLINQKDKVYEILRNRSLENLFLFNRYVLGVEKGKQQLGEFHRELCNFVTDNTKKKKLILMPRGHLKSTLITIGYSLYRIVKNPNTRVLILNATWQMAVDFLTEIKNHLQNSEMIKELYPEIHQAAMNPSEWSQDRITIKRDDTNVKGPTVWATGVESNLVGSHPDLIIADDLMNRDNVSTREQIEKVILRYKDCLDLLEPGGQLIVIGTRWTESDLYSWLMDKDNGIVQSYDVMIKKAYEGDLESSEEFVPLWPEKFNQRELLTRLREKGWYEFCTPYETPILMSDFKVKPIGTVKEGDEIIGFTSDNGKRRKLVKTRVKKVSRLIAPVYKLEMTSGRTVRCTKEHRWYTGRGETDKTHKIYAPAKAGSKLGFVCPVWTEPKFQSDLIDWNYLAGIFDGEGSAKSGGCLTITQGMGYNKEVYCKIKKTFKSLGIGFGEYIKKGKNCDISMMWLKDNFETQLKLLRFTDLAKGNQLVDRLLEKGKRFIKEWDKVKEIEYQRDDEVFALETETGNYIAWGYASSNSAQYMNDPIPDKDATFQKEWLQHYDIEDVRGKEMIKTLTIDPAISLEKTADYTAMIVSGIDTFGNIFVLDMVRERLTPSQIINKIFELNELWHPQTVGIETVAYQKALSYSLKDEMTKRRRYLPITELKPQERNKDLRIKGLQPQYASLKVFHRNNHKLTPYLEAELAAFPRGTHDDMIDAFSYALDLLYPPKMKRERYQKAYLY